MVFIILFLYANLRYLLILSRDAPVEVWAMTKNPIMVFFFIIFYVLSTIYLLLFSVNL